MARSPLRRALLAGVLIALVVAAAPSTATAKRRYAVTSGARVDVAGFRATFAGRGAYHTRFTAHPPNPGGADDHNSARDRSLQRWAIRYKGRIEVPDCSPALGEFDPCAAIGNLDGARGATRMIGWVRHFHVDGLFKQLDATDRCRLRSSTGAHEPVSATLGVRYDPATKTLGLTAFNPMTTALLEFPGFCPDRPDPIDRILSFYASPGFSFAPEYGADRWFTSREVAIPVSVLHRAGKVRIPLHVTAAGRSPADCAVLNPSYERCHTGGTWRGTLTLRRTQ